MLTSTSALRGLSWKGWRTPRRNLFSSSVSHSLKSQQVLTSISEAEETELSLDGLSKSLLAGLVSGDRASLARSITLVESTHPVKAAQARKLVTHATRHYRNNGLQSFRLGLSGPPGAGKSTFIEALGMSLVDRGHKVAVLAVDPSSSSQGGSLLADKTRMPNLTRHPKAFIRPSPSRGHLGGVTRNTNEAITLCEVCGYDVILVETVGVGQSEFAVVDMVDAFCLLLPPASGDELQGIKRGIVEQSDLVLINKSDGDLIPSARSTAASYMSALKLIRPKSPHWKPKTHLISSKTGLGLDEAWQKLLSFKQVMTDCGEFERRRRKQRKTWMWNYVNDSLLNTFKSHPAVKLNQRQLEEMVSELNISPGTASDILIKHFLEKSS